MKIVLLGPPGAGKGTQSQTICSNYEIPHISTGDIFRKNIKEKTPLGIEATNYINQGLLVPDEVTIGLVENRIVEQDCENGYLLDGFPRTLNQAKALTDVLDKKGEQLSRVILIDVPFEYIIERMTGRRTCSSCGATYHVKYNPTKIEGKCDLCGGETTQRADDSEETVKSRLQVYKEQTEPLIEYYTELGLLSKIDGTKPIDTVFVDICNILGR